MNTYLLGEITLSISTILYMIWMWPQILHTQKRKTTEGLSFQLHICLFIAACCDLIYGNGQDMEWQFRLVTISLLICLIIQHIQFLRFKKTKLNIYISSNTNKKTIVVNRIYIATIILTSLLVISILIILDKHYSNNTYNNIGFVSVIFYHLYTIPQIYKNHQLKSTDALSNSFIYILIILSTLDLCSAISLSWNWPSLVGPSSALVTAIILLYQLQSYKKKTPTIIKIPT